MFIVFFLLFVASLIMIPVALINPKFATKGKYESRKKAFYAYGGAMIASFILAVATTPPTSNTTQVAGEKIEANQPQINNEQKAQEASIKPFTETQTPEPVVTATLTPSASPTVKATATPKPTATPRPTSTPTAKPTVAPTSTPKTISTTAPTAKPSTSDNSNTQSNQFACNCSKTCSTISSCEEAQYLLNVCGCSARDADDDGIACDSSPLNCQK